MSIVTISSATLTVRMPQRLYAAFRELAYQKRVSMNTAAIDILAVSVRQCPQALAVLRGDTNTVISPAVETTA